MQVLLEVWMQRCRGMVCLILLAFATQFALPSSHAQATEMDTCTSVDACDDVAADFIGKAALLLENDLYSEAAQHLYPVMLSNRVSPLMQSATRNQFSTILETAGLFELAAEQKDIANSTTSAPSSLGLLERARLLSRAEEMEDETLAAYLEAEELAVAAANMLVIDELMSDYRALGQTSRSRRLQGRRAEAALRAGAACDQAQCRARPLVDAKVLEPAAPIYPPRALAAGAGAECRVNLNVTETGFPVDIVANCDDARFIASAAEAARSTVFQPRYSNGVPEPRINVILPFSFSAN